jgi:integrating conjugative element protein (TIGR03758 family)
MSMTSAQSEAFRAGGGFAVHDSMLLLVGLALTLMLIFAAWAIGSGFRGWGKGQLSNEQFGMLAIKVLLIYVLLTYLLLH